MDKTTLGYVKNNIIAIMSDGEEHSAKEIRQYLENKIGGEIVVNNYIASAIRDLSTSKRGNRPVIRKLKRGVYVKSKNTFKSLMEYTFEDALFDIESTFKKLNLLELDDSDYDLMIKYREVFKNFREDVNQIHVN